MMTKKITHDAGTLERWKRGNDLELSVLMERVRSGRHERGRDLSNISRAHQYVALTAIALGDYSSALGHFAAAASAWAYLLERHAAGDEIDRSLLDRASQGFILAAASADETAIQRMADAYARAFPEARASRSAAVHVGMILRGLALGDAEKANQWLTPVARQDSRTTELLDAIINHDEVSLAKAISIAIDEWKKRIRSERLQKFPDAVCDDRMIGWTRLAERVWGRLPNVDLSAAQIPPEMFEARPEPVGTTL